MLYYSFMLNVCVFQLAMDKEKSYVYIYFYARVFELALQTGSYICHHCNSQINNQKITAN